jgi:hypothetical protein
VEPAEGVLPHLEVGVEVTWRGELGAHARVVPAQRRVPERTEQRLDRGAERGGGWIREQPRGVGGGRRLVVDARGRPHRVRTEADAAAEIQRRVHAEPRISRLSHGVHEVRQAR